jgi:hypothetical protein
MDVPLPLHADQLTFFAKDYMAAATVLARETPNSWLPLSAGG